MRFVILPRSASSVLALVSIALLVSCGGAASIDDPGGPVAVARSIAQPSGATMLVGQMATFTSTSSRRPTAQLLCFDATSGFVWWTEHADCTRLEIVRRCRAVLINTDSDTRCGPSPY